MIVTIDFETAYSSDYSLTKMSEVEYILSPLFETLMCSITLGDQPTETPVGHKDVAYAFSWIDWDNAAVLAHNTRFDGAILAWIFGIVPRLYLDTLSMARAITHPYAGTSSLEGLAKYLGLPPKGKEVVAARGKWLADFAPEELRAYQGYCAHDNKLCRMIFDTFMRGMFPRSELALIDMALRMFIDPQVTLNPMKLATYLNKVRAETAALFGEFSTIDKSVFSSNQQFAALLEQHGVRVPRKLSPATGEFTWALAKNDWAFKELCADAGQPLHVQALLATRLRVKSTIEETRSATLLGLSQRDWQGKGAGWMPVPYKFYGAHTGRFSGDGGVNFANLKRGSDIRDAIEAPPGYRIVHRDASQIEARMVAWLAGCESLLAAFREGRDIYSEFASEFYHRPITKADVKERFVGKTCLAAGTRVLTNDGWIPIEMVQKHHKLWDGVEWVRHDGAIAYGLKETLKLSGVWLTPDHLVWCGTHWQQAQQLLNETDGRSLKLAFAAVNSPSPATYSERRTASAHWSSDVTAVLQSMWSTAATSRILRARAATLAQRSPLRGSGIGNMPTQWQTMNTDAGYSTGWLRLFNAATRHLTECMTATASAASLCMKNGAMTAALSLGIYKPVLAGITPDSTWTASTTTEAMNQATSGSRPRPRTCTTSGGSTTSKRAFANWKPVYDLVNAGPRRRFTVMTDNGPLIVANSVLSLGYGAGHVRFRHALFIGQGGVSVVLTIEQAYDLVDLYRSTFAEIPQLWGRANEMLKRMITGNNVRELEFEPIPAILYDADVIWLPNGLSIQYPHLRWRLNPTDGQREIVYDAPYSGTKKLYGAKAIENVCQALARIVVTDTALRVYHETGFRPFMGTYDSWDYLIPESEVQWFDELLDHEFTKPPSWASTLPLASEGGWGKTLLEAERRVNQ